MKKYLKAIWLFCSQVFIPQWGKHPKDYGQDGYFDSSGLNVPPVALSNVPGISESNVPPIAETNVPGVSL
jgi:hypothetical protein